MKKPSLDSASIQNFFLYHSEKLILTLSVGLLALFFWLGYSTPTFDKLTPSQMVNNAKQAHQYLVADDAWQTIAEFRDGDDQVMERIAQVVPVDSGNFNSGPSSYPVKRDELRADAPLESPIRIVAIPFTAQLVGSPISSEFTVVDPLAEFPPVQPELDEEEDNNSMMGGMFGGGPPMGDGEEPGGMGPGGMGMGMGPGGMGMGGRGNDRDSGRRSRTPEEEPVDAGTYVSQAVRYVTSGIREQFSATNVLAYSRSGVAVTGLIEHRKMWKNFKNLYGNSFAFFPDRDTPVYDFVQVQRRKLADDGTPGEWEDISNLLDSQQDYFPKGLSIVPEVVSAEEWDSILTMPIIPFRNFDYKKLAVHAAASLREFKVPEKEEELTADSSDFDSQPDENDFGSTGRRRSAIGGNNNSAFGGMMGPGGPGGPGGMDGMMGGPPGGMDGMGGGFGLGFGSTADGRSSADYSDYQDVNIRVEPKKAHKVVRFFDVNRIESLATYQYRVRVWIRDPNNEDPDLAKLGSGGMGGMMGGPSMGGDGVGGMSMGGLGMGGGRSGGRGGRGGGGRGGNNGTRGGANGAEPDEDQDQDLFLKKLPVASNMIHPDARERLSRAREEKNKDGKKTYFVSERHGENGDFVEIKVPENHEYLRYARPSKWSEVVEVTVDTSSSFVYAGEPVESRRVRLEKGSIIDDEPSIKVAVGKVIESGKLSGIRIPHRKEVKAGELLNFEKDAHVLHPVTRQIHRVSDVDVDTDAVVLDVAATEKVDFKKSSPIDYFYPSEALIMDADGNIRLRNDLEDREAYLVTMMEKDEKAEYGAKRRRKRDTAEEMFGPGGMGPGGMGGGGRGGGR